FVHPDLGLLERDATLRLGGTGLCESTRRRQKGGRENCDDAGMQGHRGWFGCKRRLVGHPEPGTHAVRCAAERQRFCGETRGRHGQSKYFVNSRYTRFSSKSVRLPSESRWRNW